MGAGTHQGLIHAAADTGPLLYVFEAVVDFAFGQRLGKCQVVRWSKKVSTTKRRGGLLLA